eukprot:s3256_g2.t1
MDSDEELALQAPDEEGAYAVQPADSCTGLKMTPKMPPQFDGQSSWFEYEDLIDDWLGITTLDAGKHGLSLKNALVGAASFYKSMLDNALLRDPDRGLAHFKDTLRPYFVKGVNHVFLWRFLQLFRTYCGQNEIVHWKGRFKIAQKRLLASWSDLLDLSDFPEVGTEEFIAALTAPQQLEMNNLPNDEARQKARAMLHGTMTNKTQPSGRKDKGKKGKTGFMKGKDSFMGMPWKGGKGKGKDNKGGKQAFPSQPQPANIAQTPASSTAPPEKQEPALSEEGWGYDNDTYWTDDWSIWHTSDYDVDYYAQDDAWYSWAYFASSTDQPETETAALHVNGQTDQLNQICFHMCCLFRVFGHGLMSFMTNMFLSVTLLYRLCIGCTRAMGPRYAIDRLAKSKTIEKKVDNKKGVKKPIPPDVSIDVPRKPTIWSDKEPAPMVASGPSSGHKGPDPSAPEPQLEVKPEVKTEPKVEVKVEDKKEPLPKGTLSLALQRIHEKLQSPTKLLKIHLKHYRMSTEQLRRRTSALKLPKELYDRYDAITKSSDTCSKSEVAPSRAKVSEIRSEVFGELAFIDHGEVPEFERMGIRLIKIAKDLKREKKVDQEIRTIRKKEELVKKKDDAGSSHGSIFRRMNAQTNL